MDDRTLSSIIVGLVLGAISLGVMAWRGVFSRRAFDQAPGRAGSLRLSDLLVTAGLFLTVPALFVTSFVGPDAGRIIKTPEQMLRVMLWSQAGLAIAAGFALARAESAVTGGLRGWGMGIGSPRHTLGRAALALLAIFPVLAAVGAVMHIVLDVFGHETPTIAHDTLELLVDGGRGAAWWGLIVSAVVLAPLLEELIFRGMVQTALRQVGLTRNRWGAIAWTSLLFAFVHLGTVPPHALPVLYTLSLALGWTYERWGSLWTPILLHVLFNTVQIVLALNIPK